MRKSFCVVGVAASALALVAPTFPAQADRPAGPGGGRCSVTYENSRPGPDSDGNVRFTWTVRCNGGARRIENGLTLDPPSAGAITRSRYCSSPDLVTTCTTWIQWNNDRPGQQQYHILNELYVSEGFSDDATFYGNYTANPWM